MPAMPRKDKVELRLTTLEKADWVKAAGGTRLLSQWVRQVCNEAAEGKRTSEKVVATPSAAIPDALAGSTRDGVLGTQEAHNLPLGGFDSHSRHSRSDTPRVAVTVGQPEPRDDSSGEKASREVSGRSSPSPARSDSCARWRHHRPGTYCGACKQVVK